MAVAVAPVAAMLIAGTGVHAASAAVAHDCQGKETLDARQHGDDRDGMATANESSRAGLQDADKNSCPGCGGKHHTGCIGDSGKCCKLIGVVAVLPRAAGVADPTDLSIDPPVLTGWQVRPPPPPPRA